MLSIKTFTLRLTEEQLKYVGEKAEEIGVSKNDYIRRLIDGDIMADKQDKILQEIIEVKEMIEKRLV
jgi:Ribbon-helix-helix protein, copG family.